MLIPGQTVAHYTILEKIGEGGMGVVYKARDTKLDRDVALKFLPAHLAASDQDNARFVLEAKAAAALNHPNVCSVIDIQEQELPGPPAERSTFIVMEFVDGMTLRQRLEVLGTQPMPQKQAIDTGIQIADGLAAAHEKGIVHRDIKPENIMVRRDGIVQIMDFGLAKLRARGSKISRLTKAGSTVGTAGYMSPEQVQGQETDHRSDIFSLGVLLYELFTGRMPFKGVHETALLYEIVNVEAEPMSAVNAEIDPELDRIVFECLQKDPEERYQSAKEISRDLKRVRRESSRARMSKTFSTSRIATAPAPAGAAPTEVRATPRLNVAWIAVAVLAVVAAVALWRPWERPERHAGQVMRVTTRISDSLSIPIGGVGTGISPDGKFLVYVVQSGLISRIVLRPADRDILQPVLGSDGLIGPGYYTAFSPDGQWLGFSVGHNLRKASVFGGAPVRICDAESEPRGIWWGSDNNLYFGLINGVIERASTEGGAPAAVTTLDTAAGEISHRFPELLPDGKSVLFTVKFNTITSFDEAAIAVLDTRTGERKTLIRGGSYGRYVPTGHLLYARGGDVYAVPFDLARLEVTGPPKELFHGGWLNPWSGDLNLCFSDDGTLVYVPRGIESFYVTRVMWIDRGGNTAPLVDTAGSYFTSQLSPDGEKVALHNQAANDDVWIYHIGRKSLSRLTFGGGNSGFPVWSRDGKYVYYSSERKKGVNIYRKMWDGSGKEERLTFSDRTQYPRAVSPDGTTLAFIQDGDIWLLALDGRGTTAPFFTSPATESNPRFSPDGRFMAYESNESGRVEIYIVSYPSRDGKWQVSSGGGTSPLWSPSGSELYFAQGRNVFAVAIHSGASFDYSAPKKIFTMPPDGALLADISADGKRFAMVTIPYKELGASEVTIVTHWFEELRNKFAGNE